MDEENLGAIEPETAEPDVQESEENPEVAEPEKEPEEEPERDYEKDAAFAEMRRQLEEAQKQNEELARKQGRYTDVLKNYGFEGEDADIQALAEQLNLTPEEVKEALAEEEENNRIKSENETLKQQLEEVKQAQLDAQLENIGQDWLTRLNAQGANLKTMSDVPPVFWTIMSGQTDGDAIEPEDAWVMTQAYLNKGKSKAPAEIGKVNEPSDEKDFISEAEYDAMDHDTRLKYHDLIGKSMTKWRKE